MFVFFRTVVETFGRAGLYVMTKGVRFDSVVAVSEFHDVEMIRVRLISFLTKWRLYPRSSRKFISSVQRLLKKSSVQEQMRRRRKARLKVMVRFVWAGWQEVFRRYWCLSVGFVWRSVSTGLLSR